MVGDERYGAMQQAGEKDARLVLIVAHRAWLYCFYLGLVPIRSEPGMLAPSMLTRTARSKVCHEALMLPQHSFVDIRHGSRYVQQHVDMGHSVLAVNSGAWMKAFRFVGFMCSDTKYCLYAY